MNSEQQGRARRHLSHMCAPVAPIVPVSMLQSIPMPKFQPLVAGAAQQGRARLQLSHCVCPCAPVMPLSMLQSLPYAVFVESAAGSNFPLLRSHMCAHVLLLLLCAYILPSLHTVVCLDCTARQSVPLIMTNVCTCAHPVPVCTVAVIAVRCVCGVGRRGQLGCHQHKAAAG